MLLCWLTLRSINFCFAYQQYLHPTLHYLATEYILYFVFSIGFSCQADIHKIPAQQQAVNVA
ncbi:hypothetical protein, partial [Microcoleus sp. F10-A1]|uniref:hypothetical protein n=1 Tax=Microcoleus sp. F10-A1 TaxID=2818750 RepID=UPI002FD10C2E